MSDRIFKLKFTSKIIKILFFLRRRRTFSEMSSFVLLLDPVWSRRFNYRLRPQSIINDSDLLTFIIYHRYQAVSSFLFKWCWAHCLQISEGHRITVKVKKTRTIQLLLTPCSNCSCVSCKVRKSNLSGCSILFTPTEFIHIFITFRGGPRPADEIRGRSEIGWDEMLSQHS